VILLGQLSDGVLQIANSFLSLFRSRFLLYQCRRFLLDLRRQRPQLSFEFRDLRIFDEPTCPVLPIVMIIVRVTDDVFHDARVIGGWRTFADQSTHNRDCVSLNILRSGDAFGRNLGTSLGQGLAVFVSFAHGVESQLRSDAERYFPYLGVAESKKVGR